MHIAVIGCGQMGRGAAFGLVRLGASEITLVDQSVAKARGTAEWLSAVSEQCSVRICWAATDVTDKVNLRRTLSGCEALCLCLPWDSTLQLLLLSVPRRAVSVTRPRYDIIRDLNDVAVKHQSTWIIPAGLEPGLTEICALALARRRHDVRSIKVWCGGIPTFANPPLFHTPLFGNRWVSERRPAYYVKEGRLCATERFEGEELVAIDDAGVFEGHHDGMMPCLFEEPEIARLEEYTQKTLRWPGYASKVKFLHEAGLLDGPRSDVCQGLTISPKRIVNSVLLASATRSDQAADTVILKAEARCNDDNLTRMTITVIDKMCRDTGLSAMARCTGFTAAAVTHALAADRHNLSGLFHPWSGHPISCDVLTQRLVALGINVQLRV